MLKYYITGLFEFQHFYIHICRYKFQHRLRVYTALLYCITENHEKTFIVLYWARVAHQTQIFWRWLLFFLFVSFYNFRPRVVFLHWATTLVITSWYPLLFIPQSRDYVLVLVALIPLLLFDCVFVTLLYCILIVALSKKSLRYCFLYVYFVTINKAYKCILFTMLSNNISYRTKHAQ